MFLFGDINKGIEEFRTASDAILVDVREVDEFIKGHIPDAVNVPLPVITNINYPKSGQIFLYCLRGTRSLRAARILKKMGYKAKSIGGISSYKGEIVTGNESGKTEG